MNVPSVDFRLQRVDGGKRVQEDFKFNRQNRFICQKTGLRCADPFHEFISTGQDEKNMQTSLSLSQERHNAVSSDRGGAGID